jgi:sortase (surface protein transpeptidase)
MRPGKLLTLMTCAPRWDNTHRLWVHAVLERTTPADQPPSELTEGDHS